MQKFAVKDHADSLLPANKQWQLVWNDEFDGTELDTSKWNCRLHFWGKRFQAFTDEGIVLDGKSHLQLHLIKKDGYFCSPHLQTGSLTFDIPRNSDNFWPFGPKQEAKFMHRYGYYEIRCRFPKNDGWWSAFWLQSPCIGAHPDPRRAGVECDIMENYRMYTHRKLIGGNLWGGYGSESRGHGHFNWPFVETADGWHHYGVHWHPNGYVFYADGQEVGRVSPDPNEARKVLDEEGKNAGFAGSVLTGPVSEVEQFILVSTECAGYRKTGKHDPLLEKATLPDFFEVDFVRVFDEMP